MSDPLLDTWQINARIDRYLLDGIPAGGLPLAGPTGGRSVAATFAHIHNVRLMWLQAAGADATGLVKLEADATLTAASLGKALEQSAAAIDKLIEHALGHGGKMKGFKPHVHAFVGYLISHEAHHRGQIMLALKGTPHKIDKKIAYGLWEWGVR